MARTLSTIALALGSLGILAGLAGAFPGYRGADLIGGAILLAAGVIGWAIIAVRSPAETPPARFVPEDLRADALDTRSD